MSISNTLLREYSDLKSYLSCFYVFLEWSLILLSVFFYFSFINSYWILPLFIFFIGTRIYALYSLLHDGIHYLLFKNKKLNDLFAKVFLAGPLFISLDKMRANHFKHHKFLLTDNDPEFQLTKYPEFQFPLSKTTFLKIVLFDLLGVNFVKYKLIEIYNSFSKGNIYSSSMKFVIKSIVIIVVAFGLKELQLLNIVFLFWILPFATVYQLLNRLRAYTEHFNLPDNIETRSLKLTPILSFFVTPNGLGFHNAHHQFPYIPHYNLNKIHHLLQKDNKLKYHTETSLKTLISKIFK